MPSRGVGNTLTKHVAQGQGIMIKSNEKRKKYLHVIFLLHLENWHPLTLLSLNYKITTKLTMAHRIAKVLLKLINKGQTARLF